MRWIEASKPSFFDTGASELRFMRSVRRAMASALVPFDRPSSEPKSIASTGGNCSPPGSAGEKETGPPEPFIGLATPKAGRPPPDPLLPPRRPNALMSREPCSVSNQKAGE
jgi:hypothetical protein